MQLILLRNSRNFLGILRNLWKHTIGGPSRYRKDGRENNRDAKTNSQSVKCHQCQRFCHIRAEYPSYKKTLGKTINVSLTNDKSGLGNQSDTSNLSSSDYQSHTSNFEKCLNYMAFAFVDKSENVEDDEKVE